MKRISDSPWPTRFVAVTTLAVLTACQASPASDETPAASTEGAPAATATPAPATLAPAAVAATAAAAELLPAFVQVIGRPGIEPGQLQLPFDVAVDGQGTVYVSDSKGLQAFEADGTFRGLIGSPEVKVAQGIAAADDGTLYVTGFGRQVLVFGPDGTPRASLGEEGLGPGQLVNPVDVAVDRDGNLYVADAANARIEKLAPDGRHLLTIGEPGRQNGQFTSPRSVAVDNQGRIYVGQGDDFLIQRFAPDGSYLDAFGQSYADESMWSLPGLAVDENGNAYASQTIRHVVQSFDASGDERPTFRWELGDVGFEEGEFRSPYGLAVHKGLLYVADRDNGRIQVYRLK